MACLLNSQGQGLSGKNEQSTQTRGSGPMQLHRLHRLEAGPAHNWQKMPIRGAIHLLVKHVSRKAIMNEQLVWMRNFLFSFWISVKFYSPGKGNTSTYTLWVQTIQTKTSMIRN